MTPNACSYVSSETVKRITFNDDLLLTEEALWISDRAQDEEGNRVFGHPAGVPHKNRKARRFECWPYGSNRPSRALYAYRPNEDRAVSHAWADPSTQRIGTNLRWIQASCTLAAK